MNNNQKEFLSLDIQKFAETAAEGDDKEMESTAESVEKDQQDESKKSEKMYSRSELNKIIASEKSKLREELEAESKKKQAEKEKVSKMDDDQKLKYELEQKDAENKRLTNEINALHLSKEADTYATEKGLPLGYIKDFDYTKETIDSVKEKIDNLVDLRSNDLKVYLNEKLKQSNPQAVPEKQKEEDPYLKGFDNYKKR